MYKKACLIALAICSLPAVARDDGYDYQAVLKKYDAQLPLAKKVLLLSGHDADYLAKAMSEQNPERQAEALHILQDDLTNLEAEAEPLGKTSFIEPFGRCGILPGALQTFKDELYASSSMAILQSVKNSYNQAYKDCKSQINNKPEDESDLAVIDVTK